MTEQRGGLPVLAFRNGESFEEWLDQQPADAAGAWVKLRKKSVTAPGLSKAEAIDAALCHGWIDGQLDKYDDKYWLVRFTPRSARSKWSQVNKRRAIELLAEGRMRTSGVAQIEAAKADGRWATAYAPASSAEVPADLQNAFDANPEAAKFFATLKSANRYAILYRIGSVKRPETRARKIAEYVAMLERGDTIHG
ncbi:MAG TPA: YdeI/OmpD-associated family protein [Sphingomicrobium sp.]|nr:YdeI/OmpD-associated family protein [Sphingomicrobium sp.]